LSLALSAGEVSQRYCRPDESEQDVFDGRLLVTLKISMEIGFKQAITASLIY